MEWDVHGEKKELFSASDSREKRNIAKAHPRAVAELSQRLIDHLPMRYAANQKCTIDAPFVVGRQINTESLTSITSFSAKRHELNPHDLFVSLPLDEGFIVRHGSKITSFSAQNSPDKNAPLVSIGNSDTQMPSLEQKYKNQLQQLGYIQEDP